MKKNRTKRTNAGGFAERQVHLEFTHPTAIAVYIAGSFNEWRPTATPMVPLGGGHWLKELVLPPGVYEYRLVVDGEWMPDPRASETATNPFGESNSVLRVDGCSS
jgi:1,4-alpha-glucan branching enzyme